MRVATLALLSAALTAPVAHAAPTATQTFNLHPGWNAIYLEVAPPVADPAVVFGGVPLLSVWTWNPKTTSAEFIQNPTEEAFTRAGWLGYFPAGPFSTLTNLFAIQANRAYLVRIAGAASTTITISGRPSVRGNSWVANALNLVGFHVDPASPPTFASFLASSAAHAGQAIYRLGLDGAWAPLPASTPIQSGEAYWVFCSGASSFTAPAWAQLEMGDGLDYAQSLTEQTLTVTNSAGAASVSLSLSGTAPLAYRRLSPVTNEVEWPALPNPHLLSVAAQDSTSLRLAAQRAALAGSVGEGVMELKDGRGTRILIPVSVQRLIGVTRFFAPPGLEPTRVDLRRRTDS
jgi:hypothetical protein